ncbi:Major Facilitator Superfamily/MFS_1 like family [Lotmaria passim]
MGKSKAPRGSFYTNMAILSAVLVSESLSATLMMPFVGLFVSHLQHIPQSEAGYMSGLLISVFQLGQVLTGKMWGSASDRVGRKPMIQIGLLANAIVSTFFGMSPNLAFCVVMRFIHGCANGNVLVAKTVIADITDKETEGIGFAAISIFWGVGSIVGPAIGGFLYDPVHHAILGPWLFPSVTEVSENLLFDHPALLPCLAISLFSVVTLFVISWVLPETSRHPVDPFLSLFTASSPGRDRPSGGEVAASTAKYTSSAPRAVPARPGELVIVADGTEDTYVGSDNDADSLYDESDMLSGNDSWKAVSGSNGRPQLSKRLGPSASALPSSESPNKVVASVRLAKEYDRHSTVSRIADEVGTHIVAGRRTEPRWRKNDEVSPPPPQVDANYHPHHNHPSDNCVEENAKMLLPSSLCADETTSNTHENNLGYDTDSNDMAAAAGPRSAPMAFGYREAFRLPSSRNVMVVYMCIASTESALLEIIPLWAIAEREKGGLGFASADIGTFLCISSVVYVAVNVVFNRVLKCLGGATRLLWDFSVLLWCVTSILTPCCTYFTDEKTIFYTTSFITSMREIGLSWSYSILYMYVVRSVPDDCAGSINGIAQSIGSLSRMLTMLVIPPVFAWSLNGVTHPFPFNFHFVFWVTCLPLLLSFLVSSYLPVRVTG